METRETCLDEGINPDYFLLVGKDYTPDLLLKGLKLEYRSLEDLKE